nr:response regulator [Bacteroidota bacterium]
EKYSAVKDSLYNIEKDETIKELETKYETEQKEKENIILTEKAKTEELKAQRHKKINQYLTIIVIVIFLSTVLLILAWNKIRIANNRLLHNKNELEKLNAQLQKSKDETEEALEFKSRFLANMSHEIRTPLNIIVGFSEMIRRNTGDPKLIKYIASIDLASKNLLRLLNDILDLSRIEAGRMLLSHDQVNIGKTVEDIKDLFALIAKEKGIHFGIDIDPAIPDMLELDEIRFRQIMMNLLGNAIKFTDQGQVTLKIFPTKRNIIVSGAPSIIDLSIEIEDTGIGIEPAHQDMIFESFRQITRNHTKFQGTGLGLPISKRLVEMMGGTISVKSETGKGSTFTVNLINVPISYKPQQVKKETSGIAYLSDIIFTGGKLLIADDEELNRNLIIACFENSNVVIYVAENGVEAVELAEKYVPDVILMDIKMPFKNGFEATEIIKDNPVLKHIPVLAFTASIGKSDISGKFRDLFCGFIAKPVYITELFDELAKYLPHIKNTPGNSRP